MRRREFVAAACLGGLAPLGRVALAGQRGEVANREYYQLIHYRLASAAKQELLSNFLGDAAIPALGRMGAGPVGVFQMIEGDDPSMYVLVAHRSVESAVTVVDRLKDDAEFVAAGGAFLDAPPSDPAYERMESSLLIAFEGVPKLEIPSKEESRVFQLRIYESYNVERALKKVEMFNTGGELEIFRRVGLPPVFFGEALIGTKLPNLTYMLGFDNLEAKEEGWKAFLRDPAWLELKADPAYKDTVSNITNILLRPAACSQI
jgi:hypothetical protein